MSEVKIDCVTSQTDPQQVTVEPQPVPIENEKVKIDLRKMRIDHLGIAVKSIAEARRFYESLGMAVTHEETVAHERVRTAMLPLGESRMELLEATDAESTVAKFIGKRGEGLHHVALQVPDVDAAFANLRAQGVKLVSEKVQVGAGGHRYIFVHPSSAGGVLIELVESVELVKPVRPA